MRLLRVDVEAGDGLVGQRCDQRLLVDDRAARAVDDVTILAERAQDIGIDGVVGIRPCPHRDHQDAAPFGQRIQTRKVLTRLVVPAGAEIADLGFEGRYPSGVGR